MCKHSLWAWLVLASVFCGCWSGGYKIEVDNHASMGATLNYHIVDKLDPDQYNEESMPIVVDMVRTGRGSDMSAAMTLLWCCTLGIVPASFDEFDNYSITVESPIRSWSGTGSIHAKTWCGWFCVFPYPGEEISLFT